MPKNKTQSRGKRRKTGRTRSFLSAGNFWRKIFCLWPLTWSWILHSYNSGVDDFSFHDTVFIFILVAAVLCVQTVLSFLSALFRAPLFSNILLAFFAIINIFSLQIVLIEEFSYWHEIVVFFTAVLGFCIAFVFFNSLDDGEKIWNNTALAGSLALFAIPAAQSAHHHWQVISIQHSDIRKIAPGEMTSSENVRAVRFLRTPNVYFISFDGLAPQSMVRRVFNFPGSEYETVLKTNGFRIFKNHFSRSSATTRALHKFLSLDPGFFNNAKDKNTLYNGITPSPLYEIFKANGYTTYTSHFNNYFGFYKGPHVDHYIVPKTLSACTFLNQSSASLFNSFFGYCRILHRLNAKGFFHGGDGFPVFRNEAIRKSDITETLKMYGDSLARKEHGVFLTYLFTPGHSFPPYHYKNLQTHAFFGKNFAAGSKTTTAAIELIIRFIKASDPGGIVYIFGDHGPWASRGLEWDSASSADRKFFVQDRYGVLGALYPADICGEYLTPDNFPGYVTTDMVARQIIRCLAGGEDPFIHPVKYPLEYYERYGFGEPEGGDFADYLYE